MSKFINFNSKKGVILVEAIIAMAVIVVILTALVTALVSAVNSSNFSKDQSLATSYAQEGLEIARNEKDIDFSLFQTLNGTYCLGDGATSISGPSTCSPNVAGRFTRKIYINPNGDDDRPGGVVDKCNASGLSSSFFVASTVTWTDSRCRGLSQCHKVELNSCFVNLNRISGP